MNNTCLQVNCQSFIGAPPVLQACPPPPLDRQDLDQFLEYLQISRGLSANSLRAYKSDLAQLLEITGGDFSRPNRHAWRRELHQRLSPASISRAVTAAKRFSTWLNRNGRLPEDSLADELHPKLPQPLPRPLSVEAMRRLLDAAAPEPRERQWAKFRDHALLELLYASGLRVSEAVGIDLPDLDLPNRLLLVRLGKGSKGRLVPFHRHAAEALGKWLDRRSRSGVTAGNPALFVSRERSRLSPRQVLTVVKKAAARAGLPAGEIHPHTFRASCATHLIDGGADLLVVRDILGHANVNTLKNYVEASPARAGKVYHQCFGR